MVSAKQVDEVAGVDKIVEVERTDIATPGGPPKAASIHGLADYLLSKLQGQLLTP